MKTNRFGWPAPLAIGHRGAPLHAPENTIQSFEKALSEGAHGLELDLQRTSDGVLAVHHDPYVDGAAITSLTWHEFQARSKGGVRIEQVLEFLEAWPAAHLNIELKHAVPQPDDREAALARVLESTSEGVRRRCWVSSFDPHSLLKLARLEVGVPLALLAYEEVHLDLISCLPIAAVHPHFRLVDELRMQEWQDLGLAVFVWTINDRDVATDMLALGADGLIGDDPTALLAAISNLRENGQG